jgi:hypothetical protein
LALGRGHKAQGLDRTQLAYWNPLQPGLAIWGVFWTVIFILFNGYQVFFKWNTQDFLTAYINIPIFFGLWIGWSLYMRQPFWRPEEMDFVTVRLTASVLLMLVVGRLTLARLAPAIRRASRLSRRQIPLKNPRATWARRSSTPYSERVIDRSGSRYASSNIPYIILGF